MQSPLKRCQESVAEKVRANHLAFGRAYLALCREGFPLPQHLCVHGGDTGLPLGRSLTHFVHFVL